MMRSGKKVSAFAVFKSKKSQNHENNPPTPGSLKDQPKEKISSASKLKDVIRDSIRKKKTDLEFKKTQKLRMKAARFMTSTMDSPLKLEASVKLTALKSKESPNTVSGLPPKPTDFKKTKDEPAVDLFKKALSPGLKNLKNFVSPKVVKPIAPVEPVVQRPSVCSVNSPTVSSPKTETSPQTPRTSSPKETASPTAVLASGGKKSTKKQQKTPNHHTPKSEKKTTPKQKTPSSVMSRKTPESRSKKRKNGASPTLSSAKRQKYDNTTLSDDHTLDDTSLRAMPAMSNSSNDDVDDESDADYMFDSRIEADKMFKALIHPVKPKKFLSDLWQRKPLLVKRHTPEYNSGWFSTDFLDKLLREKEILFGVNLDITTYENGQRETHNPSGRAYPSVVWDYYQNGCSVRFLNPHTFHNGLWKKMSVLQEYFGSGVGANIYLTPPGSQGFAPHYDDIEAFVIQLEGKKHWRLYNPRTENEVLPRYSSENFTQEEIGDPILDIVLEAGDLLYFPRGFIHQADTPEDSHSLHVTLSTCQQNTWGDLLEKLFPLALQTAFTEDVEFRKSLPRDYMRYMGIVHSESDCPERKKFLREIETLMSKLLTHAPVDSACDQMAKSYVHSCLPPVLTKAERATSIVMTGEMWDKKNMRIIGRAELDPDTRIKIIRNGAIRLVMEEGDKVRVYHSLENARVYQEKDIQLVEISAEVAPAVEFLMHKYPYFVTVDELPLENLTDKMDIAQLLYENCLIVTDEPLDPLSEEETSDDE
ncbi:ribosomal oxygenase 1-like [Tubulanus polymorphus]|uniref:ribosomal oxygenase 1-like n=1 Tax=Tubulanus polymorphus TaxID=672921 RepID=UPI003DA64635